MTKEAFIQSFCEIVEIPDLSETSSPLNEFSMWDSLAMLNMLALYDELGVNIEIEELEQCKSIDDLIVKAGLL